jgi:carboxylesterase
MTNGIKKVLEKTKNVLFADPNLLYKEERYLVNQPFYFDGNNGKAILLIHGWTTVPYELRRLGTYLNENGYTVSIPMLRGHGTMPKDLENVKWTDWLEDLKKEIKQLREKHKKVYMGGTSIGSILAMHLAKDDPEIAGLILMATPYRIRSERLALFFAKLMLLFGRYNKKYYPPTFGVSTTITRLISYQTYPIKSAIETFEAVKKGREILPLIQQPCFLLQSTSDHVVSRGSMEEIYQRLGSKIKKIKYIKRAYHTFISDIKNESVFEEILNFLEEN